MRSYGGIWERIVSPENLRSAWKGVRAGRARSPKVMEFAEGVEGRLEELGRELREGTYRPGAYGNFMVMDPKPRMISVAPVRDRVVHHALCDVIAPLIERRFIARTYACREGKGMHLACREVREELGRHAYFLKLDVRHYFPSIDHERLLALVQPMFREREVRALVETIVRSPAGGGAGGRGIPIGNLTSQWFANLYLDGLDHYVAEELGAGRGYFRYMDDLLVLCGGRDEARRSHALIAAWLRENRRLELKERATVMGPVTEGVPFLGLRIWRHAWRMKRTRFLRVRRLAANKMEALRRGEIGEASAANAFASYSGWLEWFGFANVLKGISATEEELRAGASRSAAAAGTTNRTTSAPRTGTATGRPRTRTTTWASASRSIAPMGGIQFRTAGALRGTRGRTCPVRGGE